MHTPGFTAEGSVKGLEAPGNLENRSSFTRDIAAGFRSAVKNGKMTAAQPGV